MHKVRDGGLSRLRDIQHIPFHRGMLEHLEHLEQVEHVLTGASCLSSYSCLFLLFGG
jgi:hypothetical protein